MTSVLAQKLKTSEVYQAQPRDVSVGLNVVKEIPSFNGPSSIVSARKDVLDVDKITFNSIHNAYGIFSYDQRFLTLQPAADMFTYANRAGGIYGNTGNDLKFKFTLDRGLTWDTAVVPAVPGHNYRYPSMVTYNPTGGTDPHEMFGIYTGPITDGTSWIEQYMGSIKLDGTNNDVTRIPNPPNTFLDHMNIGLYCSPDGYITTASTYLSGTSSAYTYEGFHILNGVFNTADNKVDWDPFFLLEPEVLEDGRTDAPGIAWSPDGSIGYFVSTAIDADAAYNPYGVEWPVVYKSTDHGLTWEKTPAFDFSTIQVLYDSLWPTRADLNVVIPRWYNKWASDRNEQQNGYVVDKWGNLHIFGLLRSTMSLHPDSINYFYTNEPAKIWDVYMTTYGAWNAAYIDTLKSKIIENSSYEVDWDHQLQMSRTPDGSKVFMLWTDTDPMFGTTNIAPDIKGAGLNVDDYYMTPVKNFTAEGDYWGDNFWMRLATDVFYDLGTFTSTLPVTTSIPGATAGDPLIHQYVSGITFEDSEFTILVGTSPKQKQSFSVAPIFPNPVNGTSTITLTLTKTSAVSLSISTILGQQVSTKNYGTLNEGINTLSVDGRGLTSGVYLYTLKVNGESYTNKMMVK